MKVISAQPNLVSQVQKAILDDIADGTLPPGTRLIQEHIAQELGVSRQPVQQALALLRSQGILRNARGRGLEVMPLDLIYVRNMYDMRAVVEGLAFRRAAELNSARAGKKGLELIEAGRLAIQRSSLGDMISADMEFHNFIYILSENPLIGLSMETHWTTAQRVMGEVLLRDEKPRDIWDQHEEMLRAVMAGDGKQAEMLAREHISQAADFMIRRLQENHSAVE